MRAVATLIDAPVPTAIQPTEKLRRYWCSNLMLSLSPAIGPHYYSSSTSDIGRADPS